jgi:hypothetical protein
MPKATKKTVKKVTKKVMPVVVESMDMSMTPTPVPIANMKPLNGKVISLALLLVVIGLLTYKVGPWVVPAVVENRPVTRFELWSRLEKSYGAQALDDMVNEKILDEAIAKAGIKVDQSQHDDQMKYIETQFESTGGWMKRGLTRKISSSKTQLAVEEL